MAFGVKPEEQDDVPAPVSVPGPMLMDALPRETGRPRVSAPLVTADLGEPRSLPAEVGPLPMPRPPKPFAAQENWGKQDRPLKEVEFKDRLASTTNPELAYDPANPPLKRKKISRSAMRAKEQIEAWDRGAGRNRPMTLRRYLKRMPWGLVLLFVAMFAAVVYVFVRGYLKRQQDNPQPVLVETRAPVQKFNQAELLLEDRLEHQPVSSYLGEVHRTLESFFAAQQPDDFKSLIRDPERVWPLVTKYYATQKPFVPKRLRRLPEEPDVVTHKRFVAVRLELPDFSSEMLSMEKTPEGFRVDWEAYVGYCEMSWEALQKEKPTAPQLFRVVLEPSSYFNHDFRDEKTHACFRARDITGYHSLFAYVPVNSDVLMQILQNFMQRKELFCVVRWRYPENAVADNQLEITEYLETGWGFREDDIVLAKPTTSLLQKENTTDGERKTPGNGDGAKDVFRKGDSSHAPQK